MTVNGESIRPNSISLRGAIRELHQRIKAAASEPDPAPWLNVDPDLIEMFAEGDEPGFVRRKKLEEVRSVHASRAAVGILTRAL